MNKLPAVREAVASGELGHTKARELPVRFQVDLTPEQEARRAAMVERLPKLGGVPADRAELMQESLAALLETREMEVAAEAGVAASVEIKDKTAAKIKPHNMAQSGTPRGVFSSRPPVQIHVHEDAKTGRMTVQTNTGERELSRAESERMRCDAAVCELGGRNTTTIPPRVRQEVHARDQHRCQAPGCGRTRFLEIHHIVSRHQGGSNKAENLVTLCATCHRLWHERRGGSVVEKPTKVAQIRKPNSAP